MAKTIEEINRKIKKGEAVVFTAEEIIGVVKEKGLEKAPGFKILSIEKNREKSREVQNKEI